jgi:hypothetical protein
MARARKTSRQRRANVRASRPSLAPLPSLTPPPEVQIASGKVAHGEWSDPSASPRGPAKIVRHWRAADPIRRMHEHMNGVGKVSAEHVAACDILRRLFDAARIGLTGRRMPWVYREPSHDTPSTPSAAAVRQARADARLRRCLERFTLDQRALIEDVVLNCMTVSKWARRRGNCCATTAAKRLVEVLDKLVAYFQDELERFGLPA